MDWLKDWQVDHFFDVVYCSGDEGVAKPDPAAYQVTLSRLGVEPREAAFVDDAIENVQAASELGLHAIHFTDGRALEKALYAMSVLSERVS